MASKKKGSKASDGQVDELRELIDQVDSPGNNGEAKTHSRRGLLKIAGAALAGAAGAAALKAVPSAAATGDAVLQGCYNFATSNAPTFLLMSSTGTGEGGSAFVGRGGAIGVTGEGYFTSDHTAEIGVFGQSKAGSGTGVVGQASSGIGVAGKSSTGFGGVFISTTGVDAALGAVTTTGTVGTGRLGMAGRTDIGGVAPGWNAGFQVSSTGSHFFEHELVRGNDASIWASRFDFTSASRARWKRINAVRVDSADGAGTPFKPFRVFDSRVTSSPPLSGGKPAHGTITTPNFHVVTVAGTGTGTSSIPADAIAVMGNLTAVGYGGAGFLAIMPGGIAAGTGAGQFNPGADPSSVNFIVGQAAIANSFVCGLHNGQLQVYIALADSHFIVDITAYMQ